ncbi:unnamed protein product [Orchesella dallaii]|uniref:Uncharacterized protein n=1 Tax=Orchesella dallaii TaxID=48710 RepID=A0ABP1QSC0_9HEXA
MMMEEVVSEWRTANEDNVSTCSSEDQGSSGSSRRLTSERRLLRFPNMTRVASSTKLKTSVSFGLLIVILIGGSAFGIVYTQTSGDEGVAEGHHEEIRSVAVVPDMEASSDPKAEQRFQPDLDVMLQDAPDISTSRSSVSNYKPIPFKRHASNPGAASSSSLPSATSQRNSTISIQSMESSDNSTITPKPRRKSKGKRRKAHRPRKLPEHAQEKPALSLLLQMKLVQPPTNSYVNYTHCVDTDSGKTIQIGWKAYIYVNTTMAGIDAKRNPFIGYGKDKTYARRTAAECALQTIYPTANLRYEVEDLSNIIKYCDDEENEEGAPSRPNCY